MDRAVSVSGQVTLEDLAALNDEIKSLIRAGVPLEKGLALMQLDLSGSLARLTGQLAECLSRGQSLSEAVASPDLQLPPLYRAVVEAGLRSGRLASALEGLAVALRHTMEVRRSAIVAWLYPGIVLMLAWILFCFSLKWAVPLFAELEELRATLPTWLMSIRPTLGVWGPLVPTLACLAFFVWWWVSARSIGAAPGVSRWALAWIPSARQISYYGSAATFSQLFSLLIEHGQPMPDAFRIAARASGNRKLSRTGEQLALAIEQGKTLADAARDAKDLPLHLHLSCSSATDREGLVQGGRYAAEMYHRCAQRTLDRVTMVLPALLIAMVAFVVVSTFSAAFVWPWFQALRNLAAPYG